MASSKHLTKRYEADCQHLNHFFSGNFASSNARPVLEIFTARSNQELKLICRTYYSIYKHDLLHLLSQQKTTFSRVAYLRASEPCNRDADIARDALFSRRLDTDVLIEVICTRSSSEIALIKQAYQARHNTNLERDVSSKTNGSIKEVLLAILSSSNHHGGRVDTTMAMCDAKTLYEAVESGKYIDQKCIIQLLKQRSTGQTRAILASYKQLYGQEFIRFLKKDKCGEFGRLLRVAIRCVQFPERHFAKQLRRALKNGNAREVLIRTVVTRAETDLKRVNQSFAAKTGWTLESLVRNEFSSSSSSHAGQMHHDLVGDLLVELLKHS